ncbi:MAG: glycosyltransferase family 2 protein, partial [Gemmatimonadetes bacterium]|nr:glycosyltransferase family 2 protein [Gemmatimonadota bacterium]
SPQRSPREQLGLFVALLVLKGRGTLHEMLFPRLYRGVDFPESRYPARDEGGFRARVERGYARMREASVAVCGITRDDEETLPLTIRRIEKTGARFRDHRVVVFEDGSKDRTPEILREWTARNPRVTVLPPPPPGEPGPPAERFGRLAGCRNRYVEHLNAAPELLDVDHVLVVDMDLRGGWSLDGLASTFAEDGWDAVGSNSLGYHNLRRTYYDLAALRPRAVLEDSVRWRVFGEAWQLRRGGALIPVESAFGGLGVYRREVFRTRRYAGTHAGTPACEHLALNEDGALRFFLNPSQITVAGTQEAKGDPTVPRWRRDLRRLLGNW